MTCPLCSHPETRYYASDARRMYVRCPACELVFVPASHHLPLEDERQRYALHRNTREDKDYVDYLNPCVKAIDFLGIPGASVLDFGCGRDAVLVGLLRDQGYRCEGYDPLYGNGADALHLKYDIVVMWEVVEHLRNPAREVHLIGRLLAESGRVVVRTLLYDSRTDFSSWWYAQDRTHVCFYAHRTIGKLAEMLCRRVVGGDGTVVSVLG